MKMPPETNGVMDLNQEEISEIKTKLLLIQADFVPTDEEEVLSLHGLVSRYNNANPDFAINGDTAQMVMSYEEAPEGV